MTGKIRKMVSVSAEDYPSAKVARKLARTLDFDGTAAFVTRKTIAGLLRTEMGAAPKTAAFLKELKADAKANGAYYIRFEQAMA